MSTHLGGSQGTAVTRLSEHNTEKRELLQPTFERQLVEDHRQDGYWIEALDINNDSKPDLIGYGLNLGEVNWYENPGWKKNPIAKFSGPVGMHHADVDGDGWMDIIICYQYGATMVDCDPQGGKIVWLQNPRSAGSEWKQHYIGRATAMHRLKVGYFTQDKKLEVLGLPIVGAPNNVHSVVPVMLFRKPNDLNAPQWEASLIDNENYRVIHGVSLQQGHHQYKSVVNSALIASEQGITCLYYNRETSEWRREVLGSGELCEVSKTGFKGSGDVDAGKIGDDNWAYITTVEPFHGNTVAVYHRPAGATDPEAAWTRTVLDVFGDPNPLGEGPGHFVVCPTLITMATMSSWSRCEGHTPGKAFSITKPSTCKKPRS